MITVVFVVGILRDRKLKLQYGLCVMCVCVCVWVDEGTRKDEEKEQVYPVVLNHWT